MKKLLLSLQLLLLSTFIFAQITPRQCWNFEENCPDPANAFHSLCIPNAQAASGTPDNYGTAVPQIAGKFAHMYVRNCDIVYPAQKHGEGIILQFNFIAGRQYTLSYDVHIQSSGVESKVILVSDMPNFGGYPIEIDRCNDARDVIPAIPANAQEITTDPSTGGWANRTFTFMASSNFNQIWFRPILSADSEGLSSDVCVDNVCVRDICDPNLYQVDLCRSGEGTLTASINGVNAPASQWRLYRAKDCNGGTLGTNIQSGGSIPISWITSGSTFTLPQNSGCYILVYLYTPPGCTPLVRHLINTSLDNIPLCNSACSNWQLVVLEEPEPGIVVIEASASSPTPFPPGTIYTFTLDGTVVQTGSNGLYELYLKPTPPAPGGHTICLTINQPGCPSVTKCSNFYLPEFGGKSGVSERSEGEKWREKPFSFSNPAFGTIFFSKPVTAGNAYLHSIQGSMVKSFQMNDTNQLDVSDIVPGQYILTLKTPDAVVSKLLLIHSSEK